MKAIKVRYLIQGKEEFSIYDAERYSISDAKRALKKLIPDAVILGAESIVW